MAAFNALQFTSGRAALATFMANVQEDAVKRLREGNRNASFKMRQSLATQVTEGVGITATMFGASHWRFIGNGRGPGKRPPLDPLVAWVKLKGLASDDREARGIASRIADRQAKQGSKDHREGNPNLFSEAIDAAQQYAPSVLAAFLQDMREPIAEQFRETFTKAA